MPQKSKSAFEQLFPMILQTFIGIVILLIAWLVITALPMVKGIRMPLDFTTAQLITALILTIIVVMMISFGIRMELRLVYLGVKFPQSGTMVKQLMVLLSVLIAYYAFKPLVMPYSGELEWIYHVAFLVAFIAALFFLGYNIYSNIEQLSALFAGSRSSSSKEATLACAKCGKDNLLDAAFCSFCGGEMVKPDPSSCKKCGAELKPGASFCAGCGATAEETEEGSDAAPETGDLCHSCSAQLKPGAQFCAGCGSAVGTSQTAAGEGAGDAADSTTAEELPQAEETPVLQDEVATEAAEALLCRSCSARLKPGALFCAACGSSVETAATVSGESSEEAPGQTDHCKCRSCGKELAEEARFCPGCGSSRG